MNTQKALKSFAGIALCGLLLLGTMSCGKQEVIDPSDASTQESGNTAISSGDSSVAGGNAAIGEEGETLTTDGTGTIQKPGSGSNNSILKGTTTTAGGNSTAATTTRKQESVGTTGDYDPFGNIPSELKGKTIKVLTWYTPGSLEKGVFDSFTAKTGIKIKNITTDNAHYLSKLSTLVASRDAPDCAALFDGLFPTGIIKGLFDDLGKGAFDLANDPGYDKQVMNYVSWKGTQYGVAVLGSWHEDRPMVFYNKTMFKNAGVTDPGTLWKANNWNWDTFSECAKKMTSTKNGVTTYGLGSTSNIEIKYLLGSVGTDFITVNNDKGTISNNLNDGKILQAMQFYGTMSAAGYVAPEGSVWQLFTEGKCAMYSYGVSWARKDNYFTQLKDEWSCVPYPSPKGQTHINPVNITMWGIGKGAKNAVAGSYFIRWLLEPNNWDMANNFVTYEQFEAYKANLSSQVYPMFGRAIIGDADYNKMCAISRGNINDISTSLKTYSGTVDSKINGIVNEMTGAVS